MRLRTCAILLAVLLFSREFSYNARADDDGPPVDVFPTSSSPAPSKPAPSFPRPGTPGMAPSTIRPTATSSSTVPPSTPSASPFSAPPRQQIPVSPRPVSTNAPATPAQSRPATAPAASPTATASTAPTSNFSTLDFPFIDVMTSPKAGNQAKVEALRQKLAAVALPERQRDIFNNSPTGPLLVHEVKSTRIERPTEPVIDLFLQSVHSLHIEVISAEENMAVVNGRDLYLGDTVIMQTGAFTTQAKVKEIKPTTIVFENPVDHHITSLVIPQEPDNLQESKGDKSQSLEDIEGISLQERH